MIRVLNLHAYYPNWERVWSFIKMHSSNRAQISVLKETVLSGGIGREWGLQLIIELWRIWRRSRSLLNSDYSVVVKLRVPKLHNSKTGHSPPPLRYMLCSLSWASNLSAKKVNSHPCKDIQLNIFYTIFLCKHIPWDFGGILECLTRE